MHNNSLAILFIFIMGFVWSSDRGIRAGTSVECIQKKKTQIEIRFLPFQNSLALIIETVVEEILCRRNNELNFIATCSHLK